MQGTLVATRAAEQTDQRLVELADAVLAELEGTLAAVRQQVQALRAYRAALTGESVEAVWVELVGG